MNKKPKKYVPNSGVIEISKGPDGNLYGKYIGEDFPTDKDQIEKVIADKFIQTYNSKNVSNYSCEQRKPPDPDFICIDGGNIIALELTELVPRDVSLRKMSVLYTKSLCQTLENNETSVQFAAEKATQLPWPNSVEGGILIEEIKDLVMEQLERFVADNSQQKPLIPREACISISSEMLRNKYPGLHIFISMVGPVIGRIRFGLTDEDYIKLDRNLSSKYLKDYSIGSTSKRFLLIHAFDSARPDFERLYDMIVKLDTKSRKPFNEVWYLFAYPNKMHMVERIFPK